MDTKSVFSKFKLRSVQKQMKMSYFYTKMSFQQLIKRVKNMKALL